MATISVTVFCKTNLKNSNLVQYSITFYFAIIDYHPSQWWLERWEGIQVDICQQLSYKTITEQCIILYDNISLML